MQCTVIGFVRNSKKKPDMIVIAGVVIISEVLIIA